MQDRKLKEGAFLFATTKNVFKVTFLSLIYK